MKYYKVKEKYDNWNVNPYLHDGNFLIANELYTEKELQKLIKKGLKYYKNYVRFFDTLEISKNKTYFFFGARYYINE